MTIEQLQKQLSGQQEQILQIKKDIGLQTVTIKADLGQEYQKIIENANSGINNTITAFGVIVGAVIILGGIVSYFVKQRIEGQRQEMEKLNKQTQYLYNSIQEFQKKISLIQDSTVGTILLPNRDELIKLRSDKKGPISNQDFMFLLKKSIQYQQRSDFLEVKISFEEEHNKITGYVLPFFSEGVDGFGFQIKDTNGKWSPNAFRLHKINNIVIENIKIID